MKNDLQKILEGEPDYRVKQIHKAWFDPKIKSYEEITTLPLALREKLSAMPWLPIAARKVLKSKIDGTEKALLELSGGLCIESVLMSRGDEEKKRRTICISSQAGCGMGCSFCATGQTGFKRNLSAEEIIGQFRFWQNRLAKQNEAVGNIVLMGQGEPLLNYENVKEALNIILENTDIGPSKITLSTAGIKDKMEEILRDKNFPAVRIAISLHSALEATRKKIMPAAPDGFINFLIKWSEEYHKILGSRSHFLSLEYALIDGINDDEKHLRALIELARKMGRVKINLIPLNKTAAGIVGSPVATLKHWHDALMKAGLTCTIRHSQGADIAAACGQLNTEGALNYETDILNSSPPLEKGEQGGFWS